MAVILIFDADSASRTDMTILRFLRRGFEIHVGNFCGVKTYPQNFHSDERDAEIQWILAWNWTQIWRKICVQSPV